MPERQEPRELLREAAAAHRPDRARMLARVQRGIAARGRRRRAAAWPRIAGAAAALAATLGAASLAAGWVGGGAPEPVEAPGVTASAAPAPGLGARGTVVDPEDNPHWSRSEVTLRTGGTLTSLTVELRVAAGEGTRPTGAWRTLPEADFDLSWTREDGFLVFRWRLRPGAEVPAGEHTFAGQYDHAPGRHDASRDGYRILAAGPGGERTAQGGFG
ncbi:hypothetical protein [Streptomyces hoynatensis]|uniref:Uncharacterized protein n=1 Tax=Streptomyces hoynatensis TaxID=1141874 RepID=A0A3A9Z2J9_9ACTN|nr:hypothetical protein [Streptomyces hoynatensis]RKN42445.1 hypothetical protein D7294_13635 [Streptomyces hoynatensis]